MAQTPSRINVPALYAALDGAREGREMSWRQVAGEVGVSPSTMTRLANGHRPDADAFMALTQWLGMPAEQFWISDEQEDTATADGAPRPELLAELKVLLRARKELGDEEREHLYNVVKAALTYNATARLARSR